MNRVQVLAAVLVVGWAFPMCGATINSSTIISAENSFPGETVNVFDGDSPPTVVQMIDGGEVGSIGLTGQSILNLYGGLVTGPVAARERSTVNVRGGSVNSLSVRDNASANVFGGPIESEVRILTGFGTIATVNIFDGLIRGNVVPDARGGILNIHGGRMGALFCTTISGSTVVNISGGSLELFRVDGTTNVHWSGGELRSRLGVFLNDSVLNIYGQDLEMEVLENGKKLLSGSLLDGTRLENHFISTEDNARIILHNVPEPSTLGLAVVMVAPLLIRRGADRLKSFLAPRLQALAVLAGFAAPVGAVTIDYDTIISAENSFPGEMVVIEDGDTSPSVVQMVEGGEAHQIQVTETSIFNYFGGAIEAGASVSARGRSRANILGGTLHGLFVGNDAEINVFEGAIQGASFVTIGNSGSTARLNIFGGQLDSVRADGTNVTVNILGGRTNTLFGYQGVFNVAGGSSRGFFLSLQSVAHWSGGELWDRSSLIRDDATLNIYGHNLTYDADGFESLTGTLLDGTVVDGYAIQTVDRGRVVLHNVPEPSALRMAVVAVAAVLVCGGTVRRGGAIGVIGDGAAYR